MGGDTVTVRGWVSGVVGGRGGVTLTLPRPLPLSLTLTLTLSRSRSRSRSRSLSLTCSAPASMIASLKAGSAARWHSAKATASRVVAD